VISGEVARAHCREARPGITNAVDDRPRRRFPSAWSSGTEPPESLIEPSIVDKSLAEWLND
jgi:hypothetical protein